MPDAYQIKDQNAMYFLTFQVVSWLDVFSRKKYKDIFIESLNYCRKNKGLEVFSFVIMTNHVHLILKSKTGRLSDTIRDLKKFTTNSIIEEIKKDSESRRKWLLNEMSSAAKKHKRNTSYQLWTHENHAILLYSNKFIDQKMNYLHQNPVKAGIVENAEDYLYSSARNYCDNMNCIIDIDFFE